jgi:hypothetical protein
VQTFCTALHVPVVPDTPHVAEGDPVKPLLQVATQVLPGTVVGPHENWPLAGFGGLPVHTVQDKQHTGPGQTSHGFRPQPDAGTWQAWIVVNVVKNRGKLLLE